MPILVGVQVLGATPRVIVILVILIEVARGVHQLAFAHTLTCTLRLNHRNERAHEEMIDLLRELVEVGAELAEDILTVPLHIVEDLVCDPADEVLFDATE